MANFGSSFVGGMQSGMNMARLFSEAVEDDARQELARQDVAAMEGRDSEPAPAPASAPAPAPASVEAPATPADPAPYETSFNEASQQDAAPAAPAGQLEAGNIDLNNRPVVRNDDGSISTVRSMSVGVDGKEYLIPTVSDDGKILSDEDAIAQFRRTNKHLGAFDSPQSATAYATKLHDDQARLYAPRAPAAAAVQELKPAPAPQAVTNIDMAPTTASPAPVTVSQPEAPARRQVSMEDFYRSRAARAAALGLTDEVNQSLAQVVAHRVTSAATQAYMQGDFGEVFRLVNAVPDGHSLRQEEVKDGLRFTYINDKTGKPQGQSRTFKDAREAAGFALAAAKGTLADWLADASKSENALLKQQLDWTMKAATLQETQRHNLAVEGNRDSALFARHGAGGGGAGGRAGGGGSSGRASGKAAAEPEGLDLENYVKYVGGKDQDGNYAPWTVRGHRLQHQILRSNPGLLATADGRARAAELSALVAQGAKAPEGTKANYTELPVLDGSGVWHTGIQDEYGNTVYLQRDVDPRRMYRYDNKGNVVGTVTPAHIEQKESAFLQDIARDNPAAYTFLAQHTDDAKFIASLMNVVKKGPVPGNRDYQAAVRSLNAIQMIRKYNAQPSKPVAGAGDEGGASGGSADANAAPGSAAGEQNPASPPRSIYGRAPRQIAPAPAAERLPTGIQRQNLADQMAADRKSMTPLEFGRKYEPLRQQMPLEAQRILNEVISQI